MQVYTKTMEQIKAFANFGEELVWIPIYDQQTSEQVPNVWFHYIGHFFALDVEDFSRSHIEFDYICLN